MVGLPPSRHGREFKSVRPLLRRRSYLETRGDDAGPTGGGLSPSGGRLTPSGGGLTPSGGGLTPSGGGLSPSEEARCEPIVERIEQTLPDFPEPPPASLEFWVPPIPRLLPRGLLAHGGGGGGGGGGERVPSWGAAAAGEVGEAHPTVAGALVGFAVGATLVCGLSGARGRRVRKGANGRPIANGRQLAFVPAKF